MFEVIGLRPTPTLSIDDFVSVFKNQGEGERVWVEYFSVLTVVKNLTVVEMVIVLCSLIFVYAF